jgi:hypothetical protein
VETGGRAGGGADPRTIGGGRDPLFLVRSFWLMLLSRAVLCFLLIDHVLLPHLSLCRHTSPHPPSTCGRDGAPATSPCRRPPPGQPPPPRQPLWSQPLPPPYPHTPRILTSTLEATTTFTADTNPPRASTTDSVYRNDVLLGSITFVKSSQWIPAVG